MGDAADTLIIPYDASIAYSSGRVPYALGFLSFVDVERMDGDHNSQIDDIYSTWHTCLRLDRPFWGHRFFGRGNLRRSKLRR